MLGRFMRLVLALALASGVLVSGSVLTTADGHIAPSTLYFPWVPNGVTIEDPRGFGTTGPYYGRIMVQNPHDEEIRVYYTPTANGEISNIESIGWFDIAPYASRHVFNEQLHIPNGTGSGAILWAHRTSDDEPAAITAVLKQASPQHLGTQMGTGGDHEIVSGYTALTDWDITSEIMLPIVQTNNNWNTIIRITNFSENVHSQSHLWLNTAATNQIYGPFVEHIPPGETRTVNLLDLDLPDEWIGSARIGGGSQLGAVAERVKNETNMLIINESRNPALGQITETVDQFAPLIFRDWFNWNTGISLLNLHDDENNVTVRYYALDGDEVHSDDITLGPEGMNFLYLPGGAGDEDAFVGAAIIESDSPVLGVVDEVKYLGDPADGAGHAMSYMIESGYAMSGMTMALPLYQKGDPMTGGGSTSGVQLFNPTNSNVVYRQKFFDTQGNQLQFATDTPPALGPKQSRIVYAMELGLMPTGHHGSVTFEVVSGGGLIGVLNNVNYDVEHDGSASFNMIRFGEFQSPPGPPGDIVLVLNE